MMSRMGFAFIAVSIMWFVVRVVFKLPDGTPLFSGNVFLFGDIIAAFLGIGGLYLLVKDFGE